MYRGQKNWFKYANCAELKKITIGIYSVWFILLFFASPLKFRCCSFCLIEKKLEINVQVSCLFFYSLVDLSKEK